MSPRGVNKIPGNETSARLLGLPLAEMFTRQVFSDWLFSWCSRLIFNCVCWTLFSLSFFRSFLGTVGNRAREKAEEKCAIGITRDRNVFMIKAKDNYCMKIFSLQSSITFSILNEQSKVFWNSEENSTKIQTLAGWRILDDKILKFVPFCKRDFSLSFLSWKFFYMECENVSICFYTRVHEVYKQKYSMLTSRGRASGVSGNPVILLVSERDERASLLSWFLRRCLISLFKWLSNFFDNLFWFSQVDPSRSSI